MRDVTHWSVSCGRGTDVDVRLHASIFVALAVFLHLGVRNGGGDGTVVTVVAFLVYVASLLAHETAHAVTAWKWGGRVDCLLLGPQGGFLHHGSALDTRGDIAVAAAGPLTNALFAATAISILAVAGRPVGGVFFPFSPPSPALEADVLGAVTMTAWINLLFVGINVLPMLPFDGARVLQAIIRERSDEQHAAIQISRIGAATAAGCFIAFWFVPAEYDAAALGLLLLSVVGVFSSIGERQRAADPEYGESLRYEEAADLDDRQPRIERVGLLRRWWRERQDAKMRQQLKTEREEEERADEVLVRLHNGGMDSLSPQDRALLQRVSARYRRRH